MLLSVRQDFPQPGEKLDPRLFSQRGGDVAQLDESAEQGSSLRRGETGVAGKGWC